MQKDNVTKANNIINEVMSSQREGINLENLGLEAIPETLFEVSKSGYLPNAKTLSLQKNKLSKLPPEVHYLTKLERLHLYDNKITSLPKEIGQLLLLQRLELDKNQLTSLPQSIGLLLNLEVLSLDDNQLTELPTSIGSLISLKTLHLSNNRLNHLPSELGALTNLETLTLDNNQFAGFPAADAICNLIKLQTLSLSQNSFIRELPPDLPKQLSCLQHFSAGSGQPFNLPYAVVKSGPEAILDYVTAFRPFNNVRFDERNHWVPDEDVTSCVICGLLFTTFFRRHHCRVCGRVVCKKCSTHRCMLHNIGPVNAIQRVCDDCNVCLASNSAFSPSKKKGSSKSSTSSSTSTTSPPFSPNSSSSGVPSYRKPSISNNSVSSIEKEYGLSESELRTLDPEEKHRRLSLQLGELEEKLRKKKQSREGLQKLIAFYAADPVAQKQAKSEVESMDQVIAKFQKAYDKVKHQLHSVEAEVEQHQQQQYQDEQHATAYGYDDYGDYGEGEYQEWNEGEVAQVGEGEEQEQGIEDATQPHEGGAEDQHYTERAWDVTSAAGERYAEVLFDFVAEKAEEVSAKQGDIAKLLGEAEGEWWHVELLHGQGAGWLPTSYLRPLDQ
ncbi:Lateral signaling target protein [Balamuthia mandrillaris]